MVTAFQMLCRAFSGGGSGELDNPKAAPPGLRIIRARV